MEVLLLTSVNLEALFVYEAENEPANDNFNLCTEDLLADVFPQEKSGRRIIAVTDNEIQQRNEARILENTKRLMSWSVQVWNDWVK